MKLFHLLALGASVVAAGCADPVIEMSLRMPNANQMPANFDLSCVTAVEVVIAGNDQGSLETPPDRTTSCIELGTAPTSFAALSTRSCRSPALQASRSAVARGDARESSTRTSRCSMAAPATSTARNR
jgi:hypothetical protein